MRSNPLVPHSQNSYSSLGSHCNKPGERHVDPNATAEKFLYQPDQQGLIFPEIPDFESVADERDYRKSIWLQPVGHLITTAFNMDLPGT